MIRELQDLMPNFSDKFFTTNDGVKLHYLEGGAGKPLILTSGWPTTPCYFAYNLPELSKKYHIYALENRGTGESETPTHGYRVSRTAMDVYNLMQANGIKKAHMMGHSMGCSTLWAFIDLFGQDMIDRLILVDQSPWLWSDVGESDASMVLHCGHRGDPYGLYDAYAISWEAGDKKYAEADYWPDGPATLAENNETGTKCAMMDGKTRTVNNCDHKLLAGLLVNHYMTDWRDIIPLIRVPTLYITGANSHALNPECTEWFRKTIPDCEVVVFTKEDRGNHIMMANSPEKFNQIVLRFLGKS